MKKNLRFAATALIVITFAFAMFAQRRIGAEESPFRKQFIELYNAGVHQAIANIIKQKKDIVPGEINSLITDAMAPDKNYTTRVYLLDIAKSMATMNVEWNKGDEELLKKVETLMADEVAKERKKTEEAEKIAAAEKVPGNFVFNTNKDAMTAQGLSPVLYPHWVHRSFFRCKACHEPIFIMKRGANGLSQQKIEEGKQCGTCHDGKLSFDAKAKENCVRCHSLGKPESKPLMDLTYYNHDKFKQIATRVGSQWAPENMPDKKIPLDKKGFINWIEMDKIKAFNPRTSLTDEPEPNGIRDTSIYFEAATAGFLKGVIFSHKVHSTWVRCSLCHPRLFKEELGANKVTMLEIKEGKGCGHCHGRVSFAPSDCLRCHNTAKENVPPGTLISAPKNQ